VDGIMNESKFKFVKLEYSYLQYHWWAIALIDKLLLKISSVRYKILMDGIAIRMRINIGEIVQMISII